ncbi:thiamine phosphate synthase [Propionicicella superfundia]|uniref:thiamine phosphate synthase n=1 Tax=Propionicicella superfundia TaxID=348582 RepID=UPI00041C2148|nr:thiamine phosphate synthase [Propionicicella superfundia]
MTLDLSVYLITDTGLCGGYGVARTVRDAIGAGATFVQVRDPHATDDEFLALAVQVVAAARGTGVPVVLNDRVHLVAAAGADGAHVGQGDMPIAQARELLGPDAILGLSASEPAEFAAARATGARLDYVGIGPVFDQSTKPDAGAALGLAGLAERVAACPWPAVAIGGIGPSNIAAVRDTGVAGASVVSAICGQPDPAAATASLVREWSRR